MGVKYFIYFVGVVALLYFINRFVKLFRSEATVIDEDKNIIEYHDDGVVYRAKIKGDFHGCRTIRIRDYKLSFFTRWFSLGILKYTSIAGLVYFCFLVMKSAFRG